VKIPMLETSFAYSSLSTSLRFHHRSGNSFDTRWNVGMENWELLRLSQRLNQCLSSRGNVIFQSPNEDIRAVTDNEVMRLDGSCAYRIIGLISNDFSKSEIKYTFAVVVNPSVCLSSVCNVRAPYSAGWNSRLCFYTIWNLGHLV